MKKICILIILFFCQIPQIFAQQDSVNIAEGLIYSENFTQAIVLYKKVILYEPKNPVYHYKLGFCYLHTRNKRDSSINCFKNSLKFYKKSHKKELNKNDVKFYLARAYRVNYMFDSAITVLTELENKVKGRRFIRLVEHELELSRNGAELMNAPKEIVFVQNAGSAINSKYTEHTPVFNADESMMIFTSRRPLNGSRELLWDDEYDENIYITYKIDGNWSEAKPISNNINTIAHEATIGISYNGTILFIYKEEDGGAIYLSEYINNKWSVPKLFGGNINTKYRETHATISVDGKTLFFTSDRPGGFGKLDIYKSEMQEDGSWSEPKNMGSEINTSKDEEGPFIHHSNKTLFFSSKGHGGLGGYDILSSNLTEDGNWEEAINLGFPINSVDDDIFYFPTADKKRAYFSSLKGSGFGKSDIYLMTIPEAESTNISIFTAHLYVCEGELPVCQIVIKNTLTNKYYITTPNDGKFIIITEKGNTYQVIVEVAGSIVFDEELFVNYNAKNIQKYKNIKLDKDVTCDNDTLITQADTTEIIDVKKIVYVEIQNVLFPYGGSERIEQNLKLDTLSDYLIQNKEAIIEIGGYCDSKGKASYNYTLGIKRANSVKNYLIENGVADNQLKVKSYGEENPITVNKKKGAWFTESQVYNRRVEFKIIRQGEVSLLIWGAELPDEYKNEAYKTDYQKKKRNDIEEVN